MRLKQQYFNGLTSFFRGIILIYFHFPDGTLGDGIYPYRGLR